VGDDYRYRYAVLCGGEATTRALRSPPLDPGDSDEPGLGRRVGLTTYSDYDDAAYLGYASSVGVLTPTPRVSGRRPAAVMGVDTGRA